MHWRLCLEKTVFEKILDGELPAEKVFESDTLIAIKDIAPVAPVHLLIITKTRVDSIQTLTDYSIMQDMVRAAQQLAKEYGIADGYRLLTNCGSTAGQTVFHLHFHLIGGRPLGPLDA